MDKQKFTNDIDRKMAGYEMAPPERLWEDIEQSLARRSAAGPVAKQRSRMARWAAAAVAVAAVTGGSLWYAMQPGGHTDPVASVAQGQHVSSVSSLHEAEAAQPTAASSTTLLAVADLSRHAPAARPAAATTVSPSHADPESRPTEAAPSAAESEAAQAHDTPQRQPDGNGSGSASRHSGHRADTPSLWNDYTPAATRRTDNNRFSLTLAAANFLNASNQQNGYGELVAGTIWKDDNDDNAGNTPGTADAMNEVILGNKGNDVYTKKKHRQPVKIGLSVNYRLTRRLTVGTGVVYSYLSSDLVSGSDNYNYTTRQQLQYVGVPLQLSYTLWQRKHWNVYATGGAMAEKCVKGRSETDYVVDAKVQSTQHDRLSENRLQYSVNAAAGLQVNATDHIGFYLEPGISYHFNNHSHITNIYKDTPFNFSLGVGVRYSFK